MSGCFPTVSHLRASGGLRPFISSLFLLLRGQFSQPSHGKISEQATSCSCFLFLPYWCTLRPSVLCQDPCPELRTRRRHVSQHRAAGSATGKGKTQQALLIPACTACLWVKTMASLKL